MSLARTSPIVGSEPEVRSAARALEILCCFSSARPAWGVTEISSYLGIPKSATHRLLRTLESFRFVERDDSRRYHLGPRTIELGNVFKFDRRLSWKAEAIMRDLAEAVNATVHLAVLDGREALELMRCTAPGSVQFTPHPMFRMAPHASALGKVLLAAGGEAAFRGFVGCRLRLEQFTEYTITEPEKLRTELARVNRDGYAISDQEARLGCRCCAAPVRDSSGAVVAAISLSSTLANFSRERLPAAVDKLLATTSALSMQL